MSYGKWSSSKDVGWEKEDVSANISIEVSASGADFFLEEQLFLVLDIIIKPRFSCMY